MLSCAVVQKHMVYISEGAGSTCFLVPDIIEASPLDIFENERNCGSSHSLYASRHKVAKQWCNSFSGLAYTCFRHHYNRYKFLFSQFVTWQIPNIVSATILF